MIPNGTAFLSSLPGTRVTAVSGGVTAPLCIREAIIKRGSMTENGLTANPVTRLLFLSLAFGTARDVSDLVYIDAIPAAITSTELVMFGQVVRADVMLFTDTVQIDGKDVRCSINAMPQTMGVDIGGFTPSDSQSFYTHIDLTPDPTRGLMVGDQVNISGHDFSINHVSTSQDGRVLAVTATRKGAPRNG